MKLLYLCHRIPYPPNKGEKIRAFHQLRALAAHHEVDLFTLVDDRADLANRAALADYCHSTTAVHINTRAARMRALPFLFTRNPLTLPYFHSAELKVAVRRAVLKHSYDRIVVYCSAMAQYVDSTGDVPIITDFVDVDSDKWTQYSTSSRFPMSFVYRREGRRLAEYERSICGKSASVVVTTEREAQLVRRICSNANVHVISNGVDTGYFDQNAVKPDRTVPTVVFTGDMGYFPNEDAVVSFARNVLPVIRQHVPDTRFLVVGRNPSRKVRELEKEAGVHITGFVQDVRTYLAKAHVAVAPFSIAAGIQNKVLEAMSYGLPVTATTRATQGLSKEVASVIHIGDKPEELAMHVVRLLRDPEFAEKRGAEGRLRVTAAYNWDRSLLQFCDLINDPFRPETRATETYCHSVL